MYYIIFNVLLSLNLVYQIINNNFDINKRYQGHIYLSIDIDFNRMNILNYYYIIFMNKVNKIIKDNFVINNVMFMNRVINDVVKNMFETNDVVNVINEENNVLINNFMKDDVVINNEKIENDHVLINDA